jgi:8-oxo-dGTP pyrophosphatase MutT (NUDIX family)
VTDAALPPSLSLAERIRTVASGELVSQPIRDAATVILLRDRADGGFEIYLLRRLPTLAFAPGAHVFPGGAVDPADLGPDGIADDEAVRRAAVREVAEETGMTLDVATLVPWSRWVTPDIGSRRYDTRFFLARSPSGQEPGPDSEGRHGGGEADADLWISPAAAVERCHAGTLPMLPPTKVTLREIAAFPTAAELLDAADGREIVTVRPRLTIDGNDVTGIMVE